MTDPNADRPEKAAPAEQTDEWGNALAEQSNASGTQADGLKSNDDRASTPTEQTEAAQADAPDPRAARTAGETVFKPLMGTGDGGQSDISMIMDVPVQLTVELGHTRMTIKSLLQLGQGSVVELDSLAGEPMDIFVNGFLIAQGEVVVIKDKYGIRLTDIVTPSERLNRLNNRR